MDINEVTLLGRCTRDPEEKQTQGGTLIATFSVVTNRQWKNDAGDLQEEAQFMDCVAFENLAKTIILYLKKGHRVYVRGRLKTRTWEEKETGNKRYKTEIIVSQVILLEKKEKSEEQSALSVTASTQEQEDKEFEDFLKNPPENSLDEDTPEFLKQKQQAELSIDDVTF